MGEVQPGDRVRVARGMYAGTVGVISHLVPASPGTYAVMRSGGETLAVYVSALEHVAEPDAGSDVGLRAGVEAVHAAVESRLRALESEFRDERGIDDVARFAHRELSEFSEALRKLLGESHG